MLIEKEYDIVNDLEFFFRGAENRYRIFFKEHKYIKDNNL